MSQHQRRLNAHLQAISPKINNSHLVSPTGYLPCLNPLQIEGTSPQFMIHGFRLSYTQNPFLKA